MKKILLIILSIIAIVTIKDFFLGYKDFVLEPEGEALYGVILLHGYGSSGADMKNLAMKLSNNLPPYIKTHTAFFFPNAPIDNGLGYKWYNMTKPEEKELEFKKAYVFVQKYLSDIIEDRYHIQPNNIIIGGFSQGATLSLYCASQFKDGPAGVLSYGASTPYWSDDLSKDTSVILIHGDTDYVVDVENTKRIANLLQSNDVETHIITNMQHEITTEAVDIGTTFIKSIFKKS